MKMKVTKDEGGPGDKMILPGGLAPTAMTSKRSTGQIPDQLDVRDVLSSFIGTGAKDFSDKQRLKDFHYVSGILGAPTAQKLLNHVFMFNNRADLAGKSPEERVQSFYDMGSKDPEVNKLLQSYKGVAQGPVIGLRSSPDYTNQQLTNRIPGGLGAGSLAVK